MPKQKNLTLGDIIHVKVLQEIQDKFAEATGIAAVIVDNDGCPVTVPSNFTRFCKKVRSTSIGLKRCMDSDAQGGRMGVKLHKPCVYHCHGGLTDLAAPIIVDEEYMGAFLAGQVVLSEANYDAEQEVRQRAMLLGIDEETVAELFAEIEVIPEKRLQASADLLYIMSNYIVGIGMANLNQKQLMAEMKSKAELERLLRETELKALKAQVNPHFLFNTLNTIARLALLEGAEKTQEVVYALSDLLRNSLKNNEELVTVQEEIYYIRQYLLIQRARFGSRIEASIEVPHYLLRKRIPAMTLQPIVENAIIHGLEPKKEGGKIFIQAHIDLPAYVVEVRDTGVGIAGEYRCSAFEHERCGRASGHTTGLGISNVHKRIQYYFGNEYGISITGSAGTGTCVTIRLPYENPYG